MEQSPAIVNQYFLYSTSGFLSYRTAAIFLGSTPVQRIAFVQKRICEIQLLQRYLYRFETPCKSPTEDVKLGSALVSQQLCQLLHVLPVHAFAVRLVETFR
ncbi:hypothetical protein TNCT_589731 [Trichonephila clavata]|uniref:Uncharacterized protein n=1 Tax=Trichonephila clavata TaxID=2740835 RepID=A0A8X6KXM7_TRICU|nr:hypothetical protein TNCT_589731 [Trichonephila clavata]